MREGLFNKTVFRSVPFDNVIYMEKSEIVTLLKYFEDFFFSVQRSSLENRK